jgi:group I intron endonuclease
MGSIYWIRNTTNGKFYIGSTIDVDTRWYAHRNTLKRNCHGSDHLQHAWNHYGPDAFVFQVIEDVPDDQLLTVEQWYLDNTRCLDQRHGYNIATHVIGGPMRQETKAKISAANKGRRPYQMTDAIREKISKALTGKPGPNTGRVWNDATREKQRSIQTAINSTPEKKAKHTSPEFRNKQAEYARLRWAKVRGELA